MFRIRGLCWTLGRVLGRALSRQVVGDGKEVSQRRRPTASVRRQ